MNEQTQQTNGNAEEQRATMPKRRPIAEIPVGSVRAAIWLNQTTTGSPIYNVTVSRVYKDREGNWCKSESFGRDELPLLARAIDLAQDFIYSKFMSESE